MITKRHGKREDSYLRLVRRFALRAVRTEAAYDAAIQVMVRLGGREEPPDEGERAYLEALSVLVGEYERERYPLHAKTLDPVGLVNFLMKENAMSVNDVGRIIGSQSAASMIVNGRREISKENARKLAAQFGLEVGAFIA